MPRRYQYPEPDVIDLTDSISYIRATVNFAGNANNSVIVLDDSLTQGAEPDLNETHPVQVNEEELTLSPLPLRKRKSRPKKPTPRKKRKVRDGSTQATSLSIEVPVSPPQLGDCPICAEPLGTNPMSSTNCGHVFCTDCIKRALVRQKKCPTCRKRFGRSSVACHPLYL